MANNKRDKKGTPGPIRDASGRFVKSAPAEQKKGKDAQKGNPPPARTTPPDNKKSAKMQGGKATGAAKKKGKTPPKKSCNNTGLGTKKGRSPLKPAQKSPANLQDKSADQLVDASRINAGIRKAPPAPGAVSLTGQQPPADSGGIRPDQPIGPGNPPRSGMIKPGEVRNPAGYPKGRPNAKTVIKYWLGLEEEIYNPLNPNAKADDDKIRVSVMDSMTISLISQARKGSVMAYRELLDRIEGKPVQSTKLLNADDKILEIKVGFAPPKPPTSETSNNTAGK